MIRYLVYPIPTTFDHPLPSMIQLYFDAQGKTRDSAYPIGDDCVITSRM